VYTAVEFRVHFNALDAGDTDTSAVDYLSLDRISPVLHAQQPTNATNQVCIYHFNPRIDQVSNLFIGILPHP